MEVQLIDIDRIKVKDRFRIDKGDIEGLAASIEEKGLFQPITVDQHLNLVAGERRYLAHKHLGKKQIMAVIRTIKGKVDHQTIELYENIHRQDLKWPERSKLEKSLFELEHGQNASWSQTEQAKATGVSQQAVSRRIALAEMLETFPELEELKTEDEAWKAYKKIEEGEVVKLLIEKAPAHVTSATATAQDHYNVGDAFQGMTDLAATARRFDFAEVDPPYGVALDRRKSRNKNEIPMGEYHEWDEFEKLFRDTCYMTYALLKENAFAVFWYGMSWHPEVLETIREVGFSVPDIPAIWTKKGGGQTASPDTTLGSSYEPFFLARKGKPVLMKPGRSNVFQYETVQNKVHPTEKPLSLLSEIISTTCTPGSDILVPFLGSGVTLRAAYSLGHTGIGWDLSEKHKDGFLKRVAQDAAKKGK